MSTTLAAEAKLAWHGHDVTMNDLLAALTRIRKDFARREAGDADHPHPRNCVMTLVAVAENEREERLAEHTFRMIGADHPAEGIVVREEHGKGAGKIDGWIRSDVLRPAMSGPRECEILTVHVHGAVGTHLAALVDPLLVSGVPTYLWWAGTPPFGERELDDALRIADALILDSARFDQPHHSFRGLAKLMESAHQRLGVADLQWSRLRPWREMIAQFFAPLDRRSFLNGISELGIDYAGTGRGNRIAACLMVGWMASSLGWKLQQATAGAGGVVAAFYTAMGERTVEVNFRSVGKEQMLLPGELGGLRIAGVSHSRTFRVEMLRDPERPRQAGLPEDMMRDRRHWDNTHVMLTMIEIGDTLPLRHVQTVDTDDEATLVLDLLSNGTHDPVFNRSLAAAYELAHKF